MTHKIKRVIQIQKGKPNLKIETYSEANCLGRLSHETLDPRTKDLTGTVWSFILYANMSI